MSAAIVTVYAVFADDEEAHRIGRAMIAEGLAACVNILAPCHSIYRWEGAIAEAGETPALFKVAMEGADALIAAITARHSYAVPAVVAWPITGAHPPYANWVAPR